jgi:hypothetical protein
MRVMGDELGENWMADCVAKANRGGSGRGLL